MIISHKLRCIFIAVPKTGTHAIRMALRRHMSPEDIEQVGLFVQKKSPFPQLATKRHGHLSALEIRDAIDDEVWQSYFKFAFVRNSWDRVVSNFFFLFRKQPEVLANPRLYIPQLLEQSRQRLLMQPQHSLLYDTSGHCLVDFVGRYDSLESDFHQVCDRIGIPHEPLDRVNSSVHGPWQSYYDESLRGQVARCYREDIERFGFEFGDYEMAQEAVVVE